MDGEEELDNEFYPGGGIAVGRQGELSVQVVLDESTSFTYSSSSIGNKQIFLEFSGGEAGDLFSFLPSGKSGESLSRKGSEEFSIKTSIAARVIEIDEDVLVVERGRNGTAAIEHKYPVDAYGLSGSLTVTTSEAAAGAPSCIPKSEVRMISSGKSK